MNTNDVQKDDSQVSVVIAAEPSLEDLHRANIASAQELLEIIEKVKVKQEHWQVVLAAAMAKEREEEMQCERVFKRVELSQQQTINGFGGGTVGGFEDWLNSKGASIGSAKLLTWFHDDVLAGATPYCAVVPMPTNLSEQGKQGVAEEIKSLGIANKFYVENFPFQRMSLMQSAVALGVLGKSSSQEQGDLITASDRNSADDENVEKSVDTRSRSAEYLQQACSSGEAVLDLVASSSVLQMALKDTPCLFLNDEACAEGTSTALRRLGRGVSAPAALLRCILIRGDLVGVEGVPSTFNQKSESKVFDSPAFAEGVEAFVRSLSSPASCLFDRSVVLMITAHHDKSADASSSFSFYLIDVGLFEGTHTDHFQLTELLLLAEYRAAVRVSQQKAKKERGADGDALGDVVAPANARVLVRMAGSQWPDISAAITTRRSQGNADETAGSISSPTVQIESVDEHTASPIELNSAQESNSVKKPSDNGGLSISTVSMLMIASAAVAAGATVVLSALKKK